MQQNGLVDSAVKGLSRQVFLRSFFLETLWNYEKMQNVGFVFCLYPALKRLYPDEGELTPVVSRHLERVNTNPAMGPLLAGITTRLESDVASPKIIVYRRRAMAALAGYGDHVFWGNLKPLAAVCGVVLTLSFLGALAGGCAVLFIYNAPNLLARSRGFSVGWKEGLQVFRLLQSSRLATYVTALRGAMAAGLGFAMGILIAVAMKSPELLSPNTTAMAIGIALVLFTVAGVALIRKNLSVVAVIYMLGLAAVAMFLLVDTGTLLL